MSNFVWDNTALPAEKADAVDIPSAASEANYITGQNFNDLMTALEETRDAAWKGGGRLAPQATAPVSGTYETGDLVYNSAPADGGNLGWVCVSGGTPGTWLEFGVIAADVVNGGGGEGGGGEPTAGDVETPLRLFGTNHAYLGLYPDGLVAGRDGALGFLTASTNVLTLANERSSSAIIHLEPGTGGWVEVTGTGEFECPDIWVNDLYPAASSSAPLSINTPDVRLVGSNNAVLALYPDGSASRRGFFGFETASTSTLTIENEKASNGHVHIAPGSGAGLKVGPAGASSMATLKAINVFTTTTNFVSINNSDGDGYSFTVSGVAMGDIVLGCAHTGITSTGFSLQGNVTGTNTVTVLLINESGGTVDPASGTLTILWADLT